MGKVQCNKGGLSSFISYLTSLKSKIDGVFTGNIAGAETCNNNAATALGDEPSKQVRNTKNELVDNPKHATWVTINGVIEDNATAIDTAQGKQEGIDGVLDKAISALEAMQKAIETFETTSGDVEFTVEATKKTVVNEVTGIEVTQLVFSVTDADGKTREFNISELVNAFYTMQGMEMQSVYQAAVLRDELGLDPLTDDDIMHILQSSGSVMNMAFDIGLYGVATEEDLNNYKKNLKDAGFNVAEDVETLIKSVDFGDEDLRKSALKYLLSATKGDVYPGAVSSSIAGLYGVYNNQSEIVRKEDTDSSDTSSSPTNPTGSGYDGNYYGNYSGDGSGSSGGSEKSDSSSSTDKKSSGAIDSSNLISGASSLLDTENIEEDVDLTLDSEFGEENIPGVVTAITASTVELVVAEDVTELPTEEIPEVPEGITKDYDALARQQYESQGVGAIEEKRATLYALANEMFDEEGKVRLRERLKSYGYSDSDIEAIVQDRNLTISAVIYGDQMSELARNAQALAKADGIDNYDTLYDNEQNAMALTNGTSVKLLSIISTDEGVKKSYEALTAAETSYLTANKELSSAMSKFNESKTKLDEITKTINDEVKANPEQWDSLTLTSYNEDVKSLYEKTVAANGEEGSWTASQKKAYDDEVAALKEKYAEEVSLEVGKASWSDDQVKRYNEVMTEYNEAAKLAKTASKALTESKEKYTAAKTEFEAAKETYYNRTMVEQNQMLAANAIAENANPIDAQTNSGTPNIVLPGQAESGNANGNEQIINEDENPQANNNQQLVADGKEQIVNDDGPVVDYGIPIVDAGTDSNSRAS